MKYLCLVYADEARATAMSQGEIDALIDETTANNEELAASGRLVLAEALEGDLNEAVQIAGRIPSARIGSIEVRPVIDLTRERSAR
jgi:hypothetical protein